MLPADKNKRDRQREIVDTEVFSDESSPNYAIWHDPKNAIY